MKYNRSGFNDVKNIASKLTFRRFSNALWVWLSYYLSKYSKKVITPGLPISISFEPTTSCNLRCPECPSGLRSFTRNTGMAQASLFEQTIDQVADKTFYLILYFQGEPYLHPDLFSMVAYAEQHNMYVAISTNAHYLDEAKARQTVTSGLDRLIISIDGTTQDTYEQYRVGGKLEKVIEGTRNMIAAKKELNSTKPYIVFQFLVVKPNEHQIEDVQRMADELGVDEVVYKTAQVYDYENGNPLIPDNAKYARYYKKKDGTYGLKNKMDNHCWKMWHSCVVTWDGKVVPCCFDKDAHFVLGKVNENDFSTLWKAKAYNDFRVSLLKSRKEISICQNCTEGTKVYIE